jgi:hypothetical protein
MNRNTGHTIAETTAPGSTVQPSGAPVGGISEWAMFAAMDTRPPRMTPT